MRVSVHPLVLVPLFVVAAKACAFDWDLLDPRVSGAGGAAGEASDGGGGSGGVGGSSVVVGGAGGVGGSAGGGGTGGQGGGALGPWSEPQPVTVLNEVGAFDDDPSFTADLLELYFNSDREGGTDIFVSTRSAASEPWGTPLLVAALSSAGPDTNPVVAPDGLTLWISARRDGQDVNDNDIYVATRADRDSAWQTPVLESGVNVTGPGEYPCAVSSDGLTFVFERAHDLYVATRTSVSSPWSGATAIAELNTDDSERQAWLAPDGLTLYFDTDAAGTDDIVVSTRAAVGLPWGPPTAVVELNSRAAGESDAWLSPNQRYMMFTRNVAGDADIFETSR